MKDLVEAFAQFSQLPKMLNRKAIRDTLLNGCQEGLFVFRLSRPDHTYRTFWREVPDEIALRDPALEVVLPEAAQLASLSPSLLVPGVLPELWQGGELALRDLYAYFSGRVLSLHKDGYAEPLAIPRAGRDVAEADMQDFELQDLAEQVGNLMKETVGLTLRFHLRIELDPALQVSETTLAKVNGLLEEVSKKLKLQ